MRISHTEDVRLFRAVKGVEQSLTQQIIGIFKGAYISDIRNRTINSINDIMSGVLTHLQKKYGQLMPHELLEREDIFKKTIYNPHEPISTVLYAVEELLEVTDITGTSYTQL